MIRNLFCSAFCLILTSITLIAQKDETLFTVNGTPVPVSEFKYIYEKSNNKNASYSEKSLQESLDLYTRFKLKVAKARELKMDTIPSLVTELESYKKQLANSYLTDREITEKLAEDLYKRSQADVRFSHIFIAGGPELLPEDTLKAYDKVKNLENLLSQKIDFETLVSGYSEDEYTKNNKGDIGFMAPMFPKGFYELENGVYYLYYDKKSIKPNNLPGQAKVYTLQNNQKVIGPLRTTAGWHFVTLTDSRPARGEVEIAQILVRKSDKFSDSQAKSRIDSVYQALQNGAKWDEMVRAYSEDNASNKKGGVLGFVHINQYAQDFENAIFNLAKDGDFSSPIKTALGYHIVKRLSKKLPESFETSRKNYMAKVTQNERFELAKASFIKKLKSDNNYKINQPNFKHYLDSVNTDRFYSANWTVPKIKNMTIFSIGTKNYTSDELGEYLLSNSRKRVRLNKNQIPGLAFEGMFQEFVNEKVLEFEEGNLEQKYPEYKALTREYEEGFLFFEVTNEMVWNKASQDSLGIEKYFSENRSKYHWEERARVISYSLKAESQEELNKIYEQIKMSTPEMLQEKFGTEKVSYTSEMVEKSNFDKTGLKWELTNVSDFKRNKDGLSGTVSKLESILPAQPKELKDARGFVIADYQDYLDKIWVEKLRKEYNVDVNKNVFNSLIKK